MGKDDTRCEGLDSDKSTDSDSSAVSHSSREDEEPSSSDGGRIFFQISETTDITQLFEQRDHVPGTIPPSDELARLQAQIPDYGIQCVEWAKEEQKLQHEERRTRLQLEVEERRKAIEFEAKEKELDTEERRAAIKSARRGQWFALFLSLALIGLAAYLGGWQGTIVAIVTMGIIGAIYFLGQLWEPKLEWMRNISPSSQTSELEMKD